MTDQFEKAIDQEGTAVLRRAPAVTGDNSTYNIPELVSGMYNNVPESLHGKLLECLLQHVGPLAIATIVTGAFARLLYRRRLDGVSISPNDATHITSEHVLELERFVEQCSPHALLWIGRQSDRHRLSERLGAACGHSVVVAIKGEL
jgi:hypothetical protein